MQSSNWAPPHCEALRELVRQGLFYSEIANAINAKFGTSYSRNAAIGRAKRMGLCHPAHLRERPKRPPRVKKKNPQKKRGRGPAKTTLPAPFAERAAAPMKLRCVGISPRLLALVDLEANDCRYPYGGDKEGEAITFCGHPRFPGSSYCAPHFHLTRGPDAESEHAVGSVVLRLVAAA